MEPNQGQENPSEREFLDAEFLSALHNVAIPPGLQPRLIHRIRQEAVEPGTIHSTRSHPAIDASAIVSTPIRQSMRKTASRRWLLGGSLASVATIALVAIGSYWFGRPLRVVRLAVHCVAELEVSDAAQEWTSPAPLTSNVLQSLNLPAAQILGEREVAVGKLGIPSKLWKLSDQNRDVYIFVFAPTTLGLDEFSDHWQVIQESGRWSLAAKRSGNEITVIATKGDVRRYFKPNFA